MKPGNAPLCVVAILLLAFFASCTSREEQPQEAATPSTDVSALPRDFQELLALLPESNSVPGWTRESDVRFFEPYDLFEYIDGAAENYLTYGFQKVVTTEYSNPQKPSQAVVEIYRMKDPRNAFGIYASELNPNSDFRQIGSEGYLGGTALNFWSGPFYVKITVFQESADLKQEMIRFAERINEKLGKPGNAPSEISRFPTKDQVPHSIRFLPKDVLGQTYLKDGFEAKYQTGENEIKVVIATCSNSDAAEEALIRYRQFTVTGGQVFRDVTSPGDGGFVGEDSYYGNMAAIRSGNQIIIVLGGPSADFALSQANACLQKN